jgi:hypothetical protein
MNIVKWYLDGYGPGRVLRSFVILMVFLGIVALVALVKS